MLHRRMSSTYAEPLEPLDVVERGLDDLPPSTRVTERRPRSSSSCSASRGPRRGSFPRSSASSRRPTTSPCHRRPVHRNLASDPDRRRVQFRRREPCPGPGRRGRGVPGRTVRRRLGPREPGTSARCPRAPRPRHRRRGRLPAAARRGASSRCGHPSHDAPPRRRFHRHPRPGPRRGRWSAERLPQRVHRAPTAGRRGRVAADPRQRGQAFVALLENIPTDSLPRHGGAATTVMVTLDHRTLMSGLDVTDLVGAFARPRGSVRPQGRSPGAVARTA